MKFQNTSYISHSPASYVVLIVSILEQMVVLWPSGYDEAALYISMG